MNINLMEQDVKELTKHTPFFREPGTVGHEECKNHLIRRMEELKLKPLLNEGWLQPIINKNKKTVGENIIGVLPGKSDKYILLIAHYDSVKSFSDDPNTPGATDNAASIAIILETVKNLGKWNGEYNIVILFPDLEEPPYFHTSIMGSTYFYYHCPIDVNKIKCSIVLDLVGHDVPNVPIKNGLFVTGAEYSNKLLDNIISSSNNLSGLSVRPIRNTVVGNLSDHHVFQTNSKPFLFMSCGITSHYHDFTDTIDTLNFNKMTYISQFLKNLIINMDSDDQPCETNSEAKPSSLFNKNTYSSHKRVMLLESSLYSSLLGRKIEPLRCDLDDAARQLMLRIAEE